MWLHYSRFLSFFIATFLAGLAAFLGLLLLIIPGIVVGIRLQFAGYFVAEGEGPINALKKSWALTQGSVWNLFLLNLLLGLINLLGLLVLVVGLLVTYPLSLVAQAHVFRKLGQAPQPQNPTEQVAAPPAETLGATPQPLASS